MPIQLLKSRWLYCILCYWCLYYSVEKGWTNPLWGASYFLLCTPVFALELAVLAPEMTQLQYSSRISLSFRPRSFFLKRGELIFRHNFVHRFSIQDVRYALHR